MKKIIAKNFSLSADDYKKFATIQKFSAEQLAKLVGKISGMVLDIGAGRGELAKFFDNYIGVDISPRMCELARKDGVGKVLCCDAEDIPFDNGIFDCIVSNFALQWMNPDKVFKEAGRVLRTGGLFGFSIPVEGSLEELFLAWQKAFLKHRGFIDVLFKFPSVNSVFYSLYRKNFDVKQIKIDRYTDFKDTPSQALKSITGIGARNPYRHRSLYPGKEFYRFFKKEFQDKKTRKYPVTYQVLTVLAIKRQSF